MSPPESLRRKQKYPNKRNWPVAIAVFMDGLLIVPIICLLALAEFWNASSVLLYYPTPDITGKSFFEALKLIFISGESNVFDELYMALFISWIYSFAALYWMIGQRKKGKLHPALPDNARWLAKGAATLTATFLTFGTLIIIINELIQSYYIDYQLDSAITVAKALTLVAIGSLIIQYAFSLIVVHIAFVIGAEFRYNPDDSRQPDKSTNTDE